MKRGSKKVVLAAAILGGLVIGGVIGLGNSWRPLPYLLQALIHHLLFVTLLMTLAGGNRGKRLLTAVILLAARVLAGLFVESLISMVLLVGLYLVNPNPALVLEEPMIWLVGCLKELMVAGVILLLPRWDTGFWNFAVEEEQSQAEAGRFRAELEIYADRAGKWYVVLSIPLLGFIAVADVANWGAGYGILVRSGGWLGIFFDQLLSHGGMCVLAALTMLAAVFYLFGMEQMEREQQESRWYHAQIESYGMMEQQYRQTESLRHDMKNHILALQGLTKGQEWEKLEQYLEQMADSCGLGTDRAATGNRVVDILLEQKEGQARKLGVSWDCQVQIPHCCGIREMDWCILLGNLLDNALEACGRMTGKEAGQIRLWAGQVKGFFFLDVENSVDVGEVTSSDQAAKVPGKSGMSGKPGETGGFQEGIGLGNVRDLAKRYDGTVGIESGKGSFRVSVLLPLGMESSVQDMKKTV